MKIFPRIRAVAPLERKSLLVTFENGVTKRYDCTPLFGEEPFSLLQVDAFFRAVRVDSGGYGVRWNDQIDLSESELWLGGVVVESEPALAIPAR